jgi:hypothetical protein
LTSRDKRLLQQVHLSSIPSLHHFILTILFSVQKILMLVDKSNICLNNSLTEGLKLKVYRNGTVQRRETFLKENLLFEKKNYFARLRKRNILERSVSFSNGWRLMGEAR